MLHFRISEVHFPLSPVHGISVMRPVMWCELWPPSFYSQSGLKQQATYIQLLVKKTGCQTDDSLSGCLVALLVVWLLYCLFCWILMFLLQLMNRLHAVSVLGINLRRLGVCDCKNRKHCVHVCECVCVFIFWIAVWAAIVITVMCWEDQSNCARFWCGEGRQQLLHFTFTLFLLWPIRRIFTIHHVWISICHDIYIYTYLCMLPSRDCDIVRVPFWLITKFKLAKMLSVFCCDMWSIKL